MRRHAVYAAGLAAVLAAAPVTRADDTELFVSQTSVRSNILFIIDTSGSMDSEVLTQVDWDPALTFSGCYRSDRLYFSTSGALPACNSNNSIEKSANKCAASLGPLDSVGTFADGMLAWRSSNMSWIDLDGNNKTRPMECEDDRAIHGQTAADSNTYAAAGTNGPWAATDADEPLWSTNYTIWDGNWLNWSTNPPTVSQTRLEVVQDVVNTLVEGLDDVNVGLMRFNRDQGGPVTQALTDVATSRQAMQDAVDDLDPDGFTPLSETLFEAAQYYRGGNVDYGNVGPQLSVAASRLGNAPNGASYRSPIDEECQKNFIILLTDGAPSRDNATARIEGLPGFSALLGNCDGSGDGACLDDLAEYLYRTDASSQQAGMQNVVTYTIGFDVDIPLLDATARRGGGEYFLADDTGSLTTALTELLAGIDKRAGTFVAPAIPVSAFNRSATTRDVFVSLFQPTGTAHWIGNLKKYQFSAGQLLDQDGRAAIDPLTEFFQQDVRSFWSADPDGDRVIEGGAAGRLPAASDRRLYTDLDGPVLTSTGNSVDVTNAAITAAVLGVATTQERDDLIGWIRANDLADIDGDGDLAEPRRQMGDPLHVRPVTLSYGATAENPDTVVFTATNDGFLHAVDADSGDERWAYLPGRLLGYQQDLFLDPPSSLKRYGLDGEIRLFVRNADGQPGIGPDDTAILIFGMGRGGNAVFAVDVSDADAPELLWQIDGDSDRLGSLGQVWAAPAVARVKVGGTERDVVILSGGYDDGQDNDGYRVDTVGNAMFILGLETGAVIWSAGAAGQDHDLELDDMNNSIPAAPRVIDLTGDGLADRMYVGDTGGRLWRFDIRNGNSADELATGGVLASLGAADLVGPPASASRRFYTTPDAVFVNCTRGTFLAINIGSGFRGHPLDTDVEDAFFSVRDANALGALEAGDYGTPIRIGDLQDITGDAESVVPNNANGWRLRMVEDDGEKILSAATTFDRTVFFNSFSPVANVSTCAGGLGINRAYAVNSCDGNPVNNLDGSQDADPPGVADRFSTLKQAGIAPESVFLFSSDISAGPTRCIGLVCFPPEAGSKALRETFWSPEPAR